MKFTVNDNTYFVKWEYMDNYVTICKIYDNKTSYEKPLVANCAYLSDGDRFCKNTGRKVSLDRALNILFPNYSLIMGDMINIKEYSVKARAIAWQEYFKESPKRLR